MSKTQVVLLHPRQSITKTDGGQQRNPFLNLYAAKDEEESSDTDTGSDTPVASPVKVSEVLTARQTTFTFCINDICCHYEGGYTRHAGLNVSLGSLCHYSLILPTSSPDANLCVYKVDVMIEDIALLYSPHEVLASAFWVQVKHDVYCNNTLEVVELPHPDNLTFHSLAGINPSLISWTIATFSAQLWQEGELINTSERIISVDLQNWSAVININSDGGLVVCEDWVKIFAGPDRGIEGCIMNYVQADPIPVHSFSHRVSEITPHNQLDNYTHDPEPPQDPIQIGDCAMVIHGPQTGLVGRIMWVALPIVWVEHIGNMCKLEHNELGAHTHHPIEPMVWDQHLPEDDTIEYGDSTLIMIDVIWCKLYEDDIGVKWELLSA
ncbi:hypothetical protein V8B97DRAFT_1915788 [Scleroderma yunnanense]